MEFMRVLQMSIVGPAELEAIRQACYEYVILGIRLRQSKFFKKS